MPLLYSEDTSYRIAGLVVFSSFMANLAATTPWKSSINAARKTNFLDSAVSPTLVVLGLVDQGLIIGIELLSATTEAGMALRLAFGPIMASTPPVASFWAAATADSALSSLSSTSNSIVYFVPPTSRPPASLISLIASSAAFLLDSPTTGIEPVSSTFSPTLIVVGAAGWQALSTIPSSIATNTKWDRRFITFSFMRVYAWLIEQVEKLLLYL